MESNESMTLLQAVITYTGSFKTKDNLQISHRELDRFVNWCGGERNISDIHPPEIGDYADQIAGTGSSPQAAERLQVIRDFLSFAKKKGIIEKNLAQHVRIRKAKTRVVKSASQDSQETIELTAEGHAQLVSQLEKLRSERGPLAVQIQRAAADKDVRENAPLEAAREQLGHVESRIRTLETTLKDAVIIDPTQMGKAQTVKIGMKVTVTDTSSGKETSYMLVNRTEANPLEGKISDISPLGKALLHRSVGQEVEVESPRGKTRYRIKKAAL